MASSLERLTKMISNTNNTYQEEMLYDIYLLIEEVCKEKVIEQFDISINAYLNGKRINSNNIQEEVRRMIISSI